MPLPSIATGKWAALPGTSFSASSVNATLGMGGAFNAWCSPTFDKLRQELVCPRFGGHADFWGNQVFSFSLVTLSWIMRRLPDPIATSYGMSGPSPFFNTSGILNNIFVDSKFQLVSDFTGDARQVTFKGLRAGDHASVTETVTLTGTTPVNTVNTWHWITEFSFTQDPAFPTADPAGHSFTVRATANLHWFFWNDGTNASTRGDAKTYTQIAGPFNLVVANRIGRSVQWATMPTAIDLSKPQSVHTYDSNVYLENVDEILTAGGIYWSPGGGNIPDTMWTIDPTNGWNYNLVGDRIDGYGCATVYDPTLGKAWVKTSSALHLYDPLTRILTKKINSSVTTATSKMVIDNANRRLYLVWASSSTTVGIVRYDISNPDLPVATTMTATGIISMSMVGGTTQGPGAFWAGGRLAVLGANAALTGCVIYTWTEANPVWQRHDPSDAVYPPRAAYQGTWNKFFTPDGVHAVYVPNDTSNVWYTKMPWINANPFRPVGLLGQISASA